MSKPRQTAFETLYRIFYGGAYSNIALNSALTGESEHKAFITRLVYGVVEKKITLDYIIHKYCAKVKPKVLIILRMGIYQLYFMDGVHSGAAVNEGVKLSEENGLKSYKGLVNAVLRKAASEMLDLDKIDDLSIKYSVPQPLLNMWFKAYGKEKVISFLPFLSEKAPVFAVPNRLFVNARGLIEELENEGIACETAGDGDLVRILSNIELGKCRAFKDGHFYIEDISSYNAVKALCIEEGDVLLDMCSAPGGKAFTAAQMMNGKGRIYALELYESRLNLIKESAERLKLSCVIPKVNDALLYNTSLPIADKIICDVPCSGFGTIRRKPEIRYKELDSIKGLPEIQLEILKTSSKYLKTGGKLLYSTCTLNKRENEKVVESFLRENPDFAVIGEGTVFPSQNGGDGFYHCVIERN